MAAEKYAHEIQAGEAYEPLDFTITSEVNQQFLYALADFDPRYIEDSDDGPPLIHPVLLLHMTPRTRSPSFRLAPGMGSIYAHARTEYLAPARVGHPYRVTWQIRSTYEKRGRLYQEMDVRIRDAEGTEVLRRNMHSTFGVREQ
jgi:hypothetical protein